MVLVESLVTLLGGLAATHELYAKGIRRGQLRRLLADGRLIRVRQGWYALPLTAADALAAARVGGRLDCISALASWGCWTPERCGLHVAVDGHAIRLRHPDDHRRRLDPAAAVTVHWNDDQPGDRLVVPIERALRQMVQCQPVEFAVAVADSALSSTQGRRPLISHSIWRAIAATHRSAHLLLEVDPNSGSGTESVFRIRLLMRCGLRPRAQVKIRGVGRVDFVLGRRLVIEIDSETFHANPAQYHADRRRDSLLSARGYRVLRFTYQQVMDDWPLVESAVLGAVRRGDIR
ncbi:endonuclease domain-containing protein [Arenivirga flava]|uniref:DUF559 domain-containing protein n=1 Tax=Arenivirga flava TaxID=1930060 RepID=A0AA37XAZ9_9MICO|nr:DUF559 domain-containing protein [Arenivirga flava]GMA28153.1 hypothetical protein GCM10025874_14060 [Arenivirga flava]